MTRMIFAAAFVASVATGVEAAPTDAVTKADLQALIDRISKLEAENKAQARRIAELESAIKNSAEKLAAAELKGSDQSAKLARIESAGPGPLVPGEGTATNESGRVWTTARGFKYYLADAGARIFDPLSESGLRITPYGYLVFEAVHNTRGAEADIHTDWVKNPHSQDYNNHTTVFSMQDSILGLRFDTPETCHGWTFTGRAEIDLAGNLSNDYAFHWRQLYFDARHETGWSILFGQTWHVWKMITPSEIDGAWMENTGYPYRRSPQIRVAKTWDLEHSSLEVRVGAVKGGPGAGGDRDNDGTQDNAASAWPLFEAAALYDRDAPWQESGCYGAGRWMLGIAGMYGRDKSRRVWPTTTTASRRCSANRRSSTARWA
ncbi:MAG: hypothetical protein J6T01_01935 [Kiritimatiellae bacterium]|nr:hypothetical protein [Kiritimatiellia bacterium]